MKCLIFIIFSWMIIYVLIFNFLELFARLCQYNYLTLFKFGYFFILMICYQNETWRYICNESLLSSCHLSISHEKWMYVVYIMVIIPRDIMEYNTKTMYHDYFILFDDDIIRNEVYVACKWHLLSFDSTIVTEDLSVNLHY